MIQKRGIRNAREEYRRKEEKRKKCIEEGKENMKKN